MLRIILIILLCSILVLSNSNSLKGVAIIALLLQAYSDTRGKKLKEQFIPNLINNKKINQVSLKVVDLIFENNEKLTKKQFLKKIQGEEFKKKLTSLAFNEITL